jgi:hypothetical protein
VSLSQIIPFPECVYWFCYSVIFHSEILFYSPLQIYTFIQSKFYGARSYITNFYKGASTKKVTRKYLVPICLNFYLFTGSLCGRGPIFKETWWTKKYQETDGMWGWIGPAGDGSEVVQIEHKSKSQACRDIAAC